MLGLKTMALHGSMRPGQGDEKAAWKVAALRDEILSSSQFKKESVISEEFEFGEHALTSTRPGESEVERLVYAIERRRQERLVITPDVQIKLIRHCRKIAKRREYPTKSKIHISDLLEYREKIRRRHEKQAKKLHYWLLASMGFRNQSRQLLKVLDRAVDLVTSRSGNDDYFHYMDFSAYYTREESRWPWMRNGARQAAAYVLMFYLFTPIYFCGMVRDQGVCPLTSPDAHHYSGWTTALYFASATLATVGYGDVTVDKSKDHQVVAGIVYMILANITVICSFSVAVGAGFESNPLARLRERIVDRVMGEIKVDTPLHSKLRRLSLLRITELVGGFIALNAVGVFANRLFLTYGNEKLDTDWTWLISIYWAVQTTTTIGYGDVDQPKNQQMFQVFYLVLSTYYVGSVLGGLAGLREELEQVREEYAWRRRQVSNNLIDELQPEGHDGKVDQYEFILSSLVQLGKISSQDVVPIMDKFRSLANESGYITQESAAPVDDATDQEIENMIDEKKRLMFLGMRAPELADLIGSSKRGGWGIDWNGSSSSEEDSMDRSRTPSRGDGSAANDGIKRHKGRSTRTGDGHSAHGGTKTRREEEDGPSFEQGFHRVEKAPVEEFVDEIMSVDEIMPDFHPSPATNPKTSIPGGDSNNNAMEMDSSEKFRRYFYFM